MNSNGGLYIRAFLCRYCSLAADVRVSCCNRRLKAVNSNTSWTLACCIGECEKEIRLGVYGCLLCRQPAASEWHAEMPRARASRSLVIKHFHMAALLPTEVPPAFVFSPGGMTQLLNASYDPKKLTRTTNISISYLSGMSSSRRDLYSPMHGAVVETVL